MTDTAGRSSPAAFISEGATVASSASIGRGTRIWDGTAVEPDVTIGADSVIGRGVTIARGVRIGDRCKIQNHALVYEPAVVGNGVFIGPGVVFTNDRAPRAITPDGTLKSTDDWEHVGVTVGHGASIGAGAICVAPISIGEWSMIAAGAVVTHDVQPHALVAGTPARRLGWVGRAGHRLVMSDDGLYICPVTGVRHRVVGEALEELTS